MLPMWTLHEVQLQCFYCLYSLFQQVQGRPSQAGPSSKELKWTCMGIHVCKSLLYNNVHCFICLLCFKKKNKQTHTNRMWPAFSLLSRPESNSCSSALLLSKALFPRLVAQQSFSKEIQAAKCPFASPIPSLALNPEVLLPAKPK